MSRGRSRRSPASRWHGRRMTDGSTFLLFAGASLALLAVPGPAVIYVVTAVSTGAGPPG
jgi:hypothetical protein